MRKISIKIFFIVFATILILGGVFFVISKKQSAKKDEGIPPISESSNQDTANLSQTSQESISDRKPDEPIYQIERQETYSYDILQKNPNIVVSVKKIKADFNINDIGTSFPSAITKLANGDEILLLSGCTPSNCGGTNNIIAYDNTSGQAYLLVEKIDTEAGYEIVGNPPEDIRNILIYYFLHL